MVEPGLVPRIARLTAQLVEPYDVVTLLDALVATTAEALGADATGLIVRTPEDGIGLLAATSHGSAGVEMYQALVEDGPCLEALQTGQAVLTTHPADLVERWTAAGPVIVGAGYQAAISVPVGYAGATFAALNTFYREPQVFTTDVIATARTFADLAALGLVHNQDVVDRSSLDRRVTAAFDDRSVVDQACGIVERQDGTPGDVSFTVLTETAVLLDRPLTTFAHEVVRRAADGLRWRSP